MVRPARWAADADARDLTGHWVAVECYELTAAAELAVSDAVRPDELLPQRQAARQCAPGVMESRQQLLALMVPSPWQARHGALEEAVQSLVS